LRCRSQGVGDGGGERVIAELIGDEARVHRGRVLADRAAGIGAGLETHGVLDTALALDVREPPSDV
jgi:hypothetical protein